MNWLIRLKKLENIPSPPLQNLQNSSSVGFVGSCLEPSRKSEQRNDVFTARLALFADRGLSIAEAEAIAERLARRDLELDDRRLCLECLAALIGGGAASGKRSAWLMVRRYRAS